ncbi:MAG: hypothetical protein M3R51_08155 [Candidatus Eremiobacteraeota bacterium]|nr:hypothetical protein [Candidatus Eremiobacteraeota bacterium]
MPNVIRSIAVAIALAAPAMLALPTQAQSVTPCELLRIATITMPKGPARYQAGVIRLSNGASLELAGASSDPSVYPVKQMHSNDAVAACFSRIKTYADAGPSRTITILDLRTSGYYGTLIGTWPSR